MGFTQVNSKGTTYHFSKDSRSTACEKPAGYNVKENQRTGLPFLSKS